MFLFSLKILFKFISLKRFLNKNVIERRQTKVSVNIPSKHFFFFLKIKFCEIVYQDLKTPNPFEDDFSCYGVQNWKELVPTRQNGYIHLDSSSIGWGCCCLQVTFQAASFSESLELYDQLIPLTPIFVFIFLFFKKKN